MRQNLKSEEIVISAPMSFAGAAQRITKITNVDNIFVKWLLLVPIAIVLIAIAWSIVFVWYLIFGIWLIPYRLIRRSQRKNKRDRIRHQELLDTISRQTSN